MSYIIRNINIFLDSILNFREIKIKKISKFVLKKIKYIYYL